MGLEYAKDGTVQKICKAHKRKGVDDEMASKIIKSILLGLAHLHKNNLVHRDIKPSNIVIDDINDLSTLKIVDFGLAVKF